VQLPSAWGRRWRGCAVPYISEDAADAGGAQHGEPIRKGQFEALIQERGRRRRRDPAIGRCGMHATAGAIVHPRAASSDRV